VSLAVAEKSDVEMVDELSDLIRLRFREGDILQFNPAWAGAGQRPFQGLVQNGPDARAELAEGAWHRMWYVYCRRDGIEKKMLDVLQRTVLLERFDVGHYSVYLVAPDGGAGTVSLPDRVPQARARVLPRDGAPRSCGRRGDGPPLVCGARPYEEVRASTEKIGLQLRRCVWIHPLADEAVTEVTFPGLLDEADPGFAFRYGLTDGAVAVKTGGPVELDVLADDVLLRHLEVPNEAGWNAVDLVAPPNAAHDLVLRVRARNPGARHLCVGATLYRPDAP
jgi:hypothetical protein